MPDGRDVIVEQVPGSEVDGPPSVLRRLNGETGAAEGPPLLVGRHSSLGMSATADRRRLFLTSQKDDADLHDRRRLAASGAAMARRRHRRDRQRRRKRVRTRLPGGRRPRARSALRTCPALPGTARGIRQRDAVHSRRADACDLGSRRRADRLGRRARRDPRDALRPRQGDRVWTRRLARRAHPVQRRPRRARIRVGSRPATGASCGRSPSRGRSSPTTATSFRAGSRSARTAAPWRSGTATGQSTSSTPRRCARGAACGRCAASSARSPTAPTGACSPSRASADR